MGSRVPRQARSRAKYQAILEAALELFGELGYTETTVDAIVERSGVSVGVFYSYFASKQQLLLSLFEQEVVEEDVSVFSLPQRSPTVHGIETLLWKFARQRSNLLRARQELLLIDPEFALQEQEYRRRRQEQLERDLEQLRGAGYIRQDIQPSTCAWVLLAIFARLIDLLDGMSEQEMAAEIHAVACLVYHMLHMDPHETE